MMELVVQRRRFPVMRRSCRAKTRVLGMGIGDVLSPCSTKFRRILLHQPAERPALFVALQFADLASRRLRSRNAC